MPEPDAAESHDIPPIPILSIRPAQPFDVVGEVGARLRLMGDWAQDPKPERLHPRLEQQARALDADAVIEVRYDRTVEAMYSKVLSAHGTAIRYRSGRPRPVPPATPAAPRAASARTSTPSVAAAPALDVPAAWMPTPPPAPVRPAAAPPVRPAAIPPFRPSRPVRPASTPPAAMPPVVARTRPGQWSSAPTGPRASDVAREFARVLETARRARADTTGQPTRKKPALPVGCAILIGIFVLLWVVNIVAAVLGTVFRMFR